MTERFRSGSFRISGKTLLTQICFKPSGNLCWGHWTNFFWSHGKKCKVGDTAKNETQETSPQESSQHFFACITRHSVRILKACSHSCEVGHMKGALAEDTGHCPFVLTGISLVHGLGFFGANLCHKMAHLALLSPLHWNNCALESLAKILDTKNTKFEIATVWTQRPPHAERKKSSASVSNICTSCHVKTSRTSQRNATQWLMVDSSIIWSHIWALKCDETYSLKSLWRKEHVLFMYLDLYGSQIHRLCADERTRSYLTVEFNIAWQRSLRSSALCILACVVRFHLGLTGVRPPIQNACLSRGNLQFANKNSLLNFYLVSTQALLNLFICDFKELLVHQCLKFVFTQCTFWLWLWTGYLECQCQENRHHLPSFLLWVPPQPNHHSSLVLTRRQLNCAVCFPLPVLLFFFFQQGIWIICELCILLLFRRKISVTYQLEGSWWIQSSPFSSPFKANKKIFYSLFSGLQNLWQTQKDPCCPLIIFSQTFWSKAKKNRCTRFLPNRYITDIFILRGSKH